MAPGKKPVGRTPICDRAYVRRIDPVWLCGPVPHRFWQDPAHRRDYLLWLGHKLHFRYMEDYYRLIYEDLKRNCGDGLAVGYWNASASEGVRECFPKYDWREWLFVTAPRHFWHHKENRHRYMEWLGRQLGFRHSEDWYRVTLRDFQTHKGGGLLAVAYYSTLSAAVMDFLPNHDWKEWLFTCAPQGFWRSRENRCRYMRWLGKRLGYRGPEDWYAVNREDFVHSGGGECLKHYHGSPALAAMDLFPDFVWQEWKFQRTPVGFWHRAENRRRYVEWLGRRLGIQRPDDWQRVRSVSFLENYGGTLLFLFGSHRDLLRECFPDLDLPDRKAGREVARRALRRRRLMRLRKRRPPRTSRLSITRILGWAGAYHERTGQWPQVISEGVNGAPEETWVAINWALREGRRGLKGGSALARLLARHRGVPNRSARPRLSTEKVLRWASRHHRLTGQWPNGHSGAVTGVAAETWGGIDSALGRGYRGLPGGSSLLRLLEKHCGVRNRMNPPRLTERKILGWARAYRRATGRWPRYTSGPVAQSPGDTWSALNIALSVGGRGLSGGLSLVKLLRKHGLE
ncbi:MAG: hypothetical protein ABSG86_25710 [Thermoguttaceae bacterium]